MNEMDLEDGIEWELKVFKKGILLRHLQSLWLKGYLRWWAGRLVCEKLGKFALNKHNCNVMYGHYWRMTSSDF